MDELRRCCLRRGCLTLLVAAVLSLGACSSGPGGPPDGSSSASTAPSGADALLQRGYEQVEVGELMAAEATFDNVLTLDPSNVGALYNLGFLDQSAGRDDEALTWYDRALDVDHDYLGALYNKAVLLETTDLDQSVALYRRAVAVDDQAANAYMRLGFALEHLGEQDEAEKMLGRGLSLDPSMAEVDAPRYGP